MPDWVLGFQANLICAARPALENKRVENKRIKPSVNLRHTALFIAKLDSILRVVLQQQKSTVFMGFIEFIEFIGFIGFVAFIELLELTQATQVTLVTQLALCILQNVDANLLLTFLKSAYIFEGSEG
jgi:hypothetical protein